MTAEKMQKKKPGLYGFFAMPEGEEVTIYRAKHGVDIPFLITVMLLLCFGSVMIFSSSYVFAEKKYGDSFFFIKKQIVWMVAGIIVMLAASCVDYTFIKKATLPIFAVSYLLLLAVPFVGKNWSGATRWIKIGPIQIQPTEIMKFALALLLAYYISIVSTKIKTSSFFLL